MPKERKKNPAAVALGKLSARSMTPQQRAEHGRLGGLAGGEKGGKIGGKARAEALSSAQRKRIAKLAAKARWANRKEKGA